MSRIVIFIFIRNDRCLGSFQLSRKHLLLEEKVVEPCVSMRDEAELALVFKKNFLEHWKNFRIEIFDPVGQLGGAKLLGDADHGPERPGCVFKTVNFIDNFKMGPMR
jgi:hypothetical protein